MTLSSKIRAISLDIEVMTGYDSVPTIEEFQFCDSDARNACDEPCGRYHCVWPRCGWTSRYPHIIWLHEMFGHTDTGGVFLGWTRQQFIKEIRDA